MNITIFRVYICYVVLGSVNIYQLVGRISELSRNIPPPLKNSPHKMQMFFKPQCNEYFRPWKKGPSLMPLMGPHLDDLHQFFIGFTFDPLLRIAFDPADSCPLRPAIKKALGFLRGLPFLRASTVDQS